MPARDYLSGRAPGRSEAPAKPSVPLQVAKYAPQPRAATPSVPTRWASPAEQKAFIQRIMPVANQVAGKLNVPASAIAAQWAYESGWGKSQQARLSHNLAGLKADARWKGPTREYGTHEDNRTRFITAKFREYPNEAEFGKNYAQFMDVPRYRNAGAFNNPSGEDYIKRINQAGYSGDTPEEYASNVASIVRRIQPHIQPPRAEIVAPPPTAVASR